MLDSYLEGITQCQRNWNHEEGIEESHIDELIKVAHGTPKKNMRSYFSLIALTSREAIKEFAAVTLPKAMGLDDAVIQSQMWAPFVMGWVDDYDLTKEYEKTKQANANFDKLMVGVHTGMSTALVALKAHSLGYSTGFNGCYSSSGHILKKYGVNGEVKLFMGIGKPLHTDAYYDKLDPVIRDGELYTTKTRKPEDIVEDSNSRNTQFLQFPPKTLRL